MCDCVPKAYSLLCQLERGWEIQEVTLALGKLPSEETNIVSTGASFKGNLLDEMAAPSSHQIENPCPAGSPTKAQTAQD